MTQKCTSGEKRVSGEGDWSGAKEFELGGKVGFKRDEC